MKCAINALKTGKMTYYTKKTFNC